MESPFNDLFLLSIMYHFKLLYFVSQFREYWLRESVHKKAANILFCDTMGFEQFDTMEGPSQKDIEYIMDGHIVDGYMVRKGTLWTE